MTLPKEHNNTPVTNSKEMERPDMVANACNPRYAIDKDWEHHGLRPVWEKKNVSKTPFQQVVYGGSHL
jgi:hypothetical protein